MPMKPWENESLAANDLSVRQNFSAWFGASKVIDTNGNPLVVHHGTPSRFDAFQIGVESKNFGTFGSLSVKRMGAFFAEDEAFAKTFSGNKGHVLHSYLSIQQPVDLSEGYPDEVWQTMRNMLREQNLENMAPDGMWELFDHGFPGAKEFVEALKMQGYDGARISERDAHGESRVVWVAFHAEQIKSAQDNCGLYLKNSGCMTDHRAAEELLRANQARQSLSKPQGHPAP